MKMAIDEAIKHCEEVANQNEFEARIYDELNRASDEEYRNDHCQCAADHRQLADWLRELQELREKHWDECRQIAHYDDELKQLMEYAKFTALDNLDLQDEIRELKQMIGGENI